MTNVCDDSLTINKKPAFGWVKSAKIHRQPINLRNDGDDEF
jgi:hypothetical protein